MKQKPRVHLVRYLPAPSAALSSSPSSPKTNKKREQKMVQRISENTPNSYRSVADTTAPIARLELTNFLVFTLAPKVSEEQLFHSLWRSGFSSGTATAAAVEVTAPAIRGNFTDRSDFLHRTASYTPLSEMPCCMPLRVCVCVSVGANSGHLGRAGGFCLPQSVFISTSSFLLPQSVWRYPKPFALCCSKAVIISVAAAAAAATAAVNPCPRFVDQSRENGCVVEFPAAGPAEEPFFHQDCKKTSRLHAPLLCLPCVHALGLVGRALCRRPRLSSSLIMTGHLKSLRVKYHLGGGGGGIRLCVWTQKARESIISVHAWVRARACPLHSLSSVGLQRKNARARTHSCAREGAHFEPVYITLYSEADTGFIILLEKEEEEEDVVINSFKSKRGRCLPLPSFVHCTSDTSGSYVGVHVRLLFLVRRRGARDSGSCKSCLIVAVLRFVCVCVNAQIKSMFGKRWRMPVRTHPRANPSVGGGGGGSSSYGDDEDDDDDSVHAHHF
ncbi:unnamed protein product [Mesocestoides corti]|uniref:Uncharacterized protein n=1 Tax=Mesocestoides corti TaxID=53468 RepID=A0A0R3ULA5_MESCO|nr:unnamed protein product [Mesocestoides corti]